MNRTAPEDLYFDFKLRDIMTVCQFGSGHFCWSK